MYVLYLKYFIFVKNFKFKLFSDKTVLVCEQGTLRMKCPKGKSIKVKGALYGRLKRDMRSCPKPGLSKFRGRIFKSVCAARKSTAIVRKSCNGKRVCNVQAKSKIFGNPCKGIFKYLRVQYFCKKSNKLFLNNH